MIIQIHINEDISLECACQYIGSCDTITENCASNCTPLSKRHHAYFLFIKAQKKS